MSLHYVCVLQILHNFHTHFFKGGLSRSRFLVLWRSLWSSSALSIWIVASSCREMLWKLIHLWLCNMTTSSLVKRRKPNSVGLITWSKKIFVEIGCLYGNFWWLKLAFHYWEIYCVEFKEYKKQTALKGEQYVYSLKKKKKTNKLERVEIGAYFSSGGRMASFENTSVRLISCFKGN